jgi:hypothetical protein
MEMGTESCSHVHAMRPRCVLKSVHRQLAVTLSVGRSVIVSVSEGKGTQGLMEESKVCRARFIVVRFGSLATKWQTALIRRTSVGQLDRMDEPTYRRFAALDP